GADTCLSHNFALGIRLRCTAFPDSCLNCRRISTQTNSPPHGLSSAVRGRTARYCVGGAVPCVSDGTKRVDRFTNVGANLCVVFLVSERAGEDHLQSIGDKFPSAVSRLMDQNINTPVHVPEHTPQDRLNSCGIRQCSPESVRPLLAGSRNEGQGVNP